MTPLSRTPLNLAERFVGLRELSAKGQDHPFIQWCFSVSGYGHDEPDETPWCSAFVNGIAWLLDTPRSGSAAARSWLRVGKQINLTVAEPGFDVVVLKRGSGVQPGPEVIKAQGHVGFFYGLVAEHVLVLGGNQSNAVNIERFPLWRVLGVRRLVAE